MGPVRVREDKEPQGRAACTLAARVLLSVRLSYLSLVSSPVFKVPCALGFQVSKMLRSASIEQ